MICELYYAAVIYVFCNMPSCNVPFCNYPAIIYPAVIYPVAIYPFVEYHAVIVGEGLNIYSVAMLSTRLD